MSLLELRPAGPNEHRCIMRQAVDFYRALVVGGLYEVESSSGLDFRSSLTRALKHCVAVHPILSAVILDQESEHPRFAKPARLDLQQHIIIAPPRSRTGTKDWREDTKPLLRRALDTALSNVDSIPPWRVYVELQSPEHISNGSGGSGPPSPSSTPSQRYLLLFAYYHSHGDGMSGLAFHRTLLQGLNLATSRNNIDIASFPYDDDPYCPTTSHTLLPSIEQAGKLSVSVSYLLSPILGQYLPGFMARLLGLRPSATPEAPGSWRGRPTCFYDKDNHVSGIEVLAVPAPVLAAALAQCRRRPGVRLTGLIHQLIVRALSELLPEDEATTGPARSFVTQTAVDLRRSIAGLTRDDMAVCVTGYYEAFPRVARPDAWHGWTEPGATASDDDDSGHALWRAARRTTAGLAATASTLHNQPVGLLRFLNDFRGWTLAHVGKPRDASYELSNLTAFDPAATSVSTHSAAGSRRSSRRSSARSNDDDDGTGAGDDGDAKNLVSGAGDRDRGATWSIAGVTFAQPANVTGGCFDVNVVSLRDGDLTATITWQRDALGVDDEDAFAARLVGKIGAWFRELADAEERQTQAKKVAT